MRVTSKMSSDSAIYNIGLSRQKIDRLNELIASETKVGKPSVDPVSANKILSVETQIKNTEQYVANSKNAQQWIKMSGTVLEGVQKSLLEVKGIAGSAVGGLSDPYKRADMVARLKLYRDQIVDMTNTAQVGEQYIFSGFKGNIKPFETTALASTVTNGSNAVTGIDTTDLHLGMPIAGTGIPDGTIVTSITGVGPGSSITLSNSATAAGTSVSFTGKFTGTDDKYYAEVSQGMTMQINVTGGNMLRGTVAGSVDIIKSIDKLVYDITNIDQAAIQTDISNLDSANKQIMSVVGDIGMRSARLDNVLSYQQRTDDALKTILSDLQEVDMSKAAIELNSQKTAFEAALAATAKVSSISLLNYL